MAKRIYKSCLYGSLITPPRYDEGHACDSAYRPRPALAVTMARRYHMSRPAHGTIATGFQLSEVLCPSFETTKKLWVVRLADGPLGQNVSVLLFGGVAQALARRPIARRRRTTLIALSSKGGGADRDQGRRDLVRLLPARSPLAAPASGSHRDSALVRLRVGRRDAAISIPPSPVKLRLGKRRGISVRSQPLPEPVHNRLDNADRAFAHDCSW
jgi:hypothetical protein